MATMDRIMSQLVKEQEHSRSAAVDETKYCSLCDKYFFNKDLLQVHIQQSGRHPRCDTCEKSFLNKNSLRNHYVLSNRHHYCSLCRKHFKSPAGLKIHLEQSSVHTDEYDSDDDFELDSRPDGWEDELAAQQEVKQTAEPEAEVVVEAGDVPSRVQASIAILKLKTRMGEVKGKASTLKQKALKQTCAICFSNPRKMCVTNCGHLFCSSCIHHSFEAGQGCPSCRKPGNVSQLLRIDLSVH